MNKKKKQQRQEIFENLVNKRLLDKVCPCCGATYTPEDESCLVCNFKFNKIKPKKRS